MAARPDTSGRKPGAPPAPGLRPSVGTILLVLLGGWLLMRAFALPASEHRVPSSEFTAAVEARRFSSVEIGEGWARGLPIRATTPTGEAPAPGAPSPATSPELRPWYTRLVPGTEAKLVDRLQELGIAYSAASPAVGASLWSWVLPILALLLFWGWMFRRMGSQLQGPRGALSFGRMQAKVQLESDTKTRFSDVAGEEEAVEELREIVEFLRTPEKFRRLGARIPKGVLLLGPPGTGKTLLARAVAGEAGVPFFSLTGSQFVEMFVGVGAARVRDLFAQAQAKAPCIVFIDELDAIGKSRTAGVFAHEEREQTLDQLLAEMDGFDARVGLIILAATNRPEVLDPALLRPGRFDRQVLVDRPDREGRAAVLRIHAKGVKLAKDVDLGEIASETPGFAGADLANVVNEAALLAARRGKDEVTRAELDEAVERVVAGLAKRSRRLDARERRIVAHHESGHAVVGWMLPRAERVRKVSIVPRGVAALGYTMARPFEDRYLASEPELRAKVATLLGGRAAEEAFYGEITTGSANDLQEATDLARAMVRDFGMSPLGAVSLGEERSRFLGPPAAGGERGLRQVSETTHRRVDAEVQRILDEALETARQVIAEHREELERLAAQLLEHESLEEEDIARVLGPKHGRHPPAGPGDVYAPAPMQTGGSPPGP